MSKPDTTRIALIALLLLAACDKPMTNDEIIAAIKKCEAAGLKATAQHENIGRENSITRIECQPN